jgi:hypothetical protein
MVKVHRLVNDAVKSGRTGRIGGVSVRMSRSPESDVSVTFLQRTEDKSHGARESPRLGTQIVN